VPGSPLHAKHHHVVSGALAEDEEGVPGAPSGHRGGASADPRQLQSWIDQRVTVSLSILKHVAYGGSDRDAGAVTSARLELMRAGALEVAAKLWRHVFSSPPLPSAGPVSDGSGSGRQRMLLTASPGLHEMIGLLTNLVSGGCVEARSRLAMTAAGCDVPLLHSLVDMLFSVSVGGVYSNTIPTQDIRMEVMDHLARWHQNIPCLLSTADKPFR
jgi:hypothetical protein